MNTTVDTTILDRLNFALSESDRLLTELAASIKDLIDERNALRALLVETHALLSNKPTTANRFFSDYNKQMWHAHATVLCQSIAEALAPSEVPSEARTVY